MAAPKIRVRSKLTGDIALIAPSALKHFPDYEPVDASQAPAGSPLPPAAAVERPKTTSRAAAKNDEE